MYDFAIGNGEGITFRIKNITIYWVLEWFCHMGVKAGANSKSELLKTKRSVGHRASTYMGKKLFESVVRSSNFFAMGHSFVVFMCLYSIILSLLILIGRVFILFSEGSAYELVEGDHKEGLMSADHQI